MYIRTICLSILASALALALPAQALDDSNRDYDFSPPRGYASVDFGLAPYSVDVPNDVLVQHDGRIVLAGVAGRGGGATDPIATGSRHGALARLTAAGTPDPTFNETGLATFQVSDQTDTIIRAAAQQPDGKIVVTGIWGNNPSIPSIFVARFLPNGVMDSAFSGSGLLVLVGLGRAADIAVHDSGRIVVASTLDEGDMVVTAVRADGTLDQAFGSAGFVFLDFTTEGQPASFDEARSVLVQPDGRIVVAGRGAQTFPEATVRFAVARLNPDGSLDTGFGASGRQAIGFDWCAPQHAGADNAFATELALGPNGQIVLGGYGYDVRCGEGLYITAIAVLDGSGQLDPAFSGDGMHSDWYFGEQPAYETLQGLAVDSASRIVLAGFGTDSFILKAGVARLLPNGDLDASFAGDGIGQYDLGEARHVYASAIALQGDHPIVAGVRLPMPSNPSDRDFLAFRIIGDRLFADGMQPRQ